MQVISTTLPVLSQGRHILKKGKINLQTKLRLNSNSFGNVSHERKCYIAALNLIETVITLQ